MKIRVALLLFVCLTQCFAFGQVKVTKSDDLVVLDKGLQVARVGSYRRNPVHTDPLEAIVVAGKWSKPKASEKITDAAGNEYEWTLAKADENGWYTGSGQFGGGGYLFVPVHSETDRVMILHMKGNNSVTVNGQPHVGSRYQRSDVTDPWAPSFDFVRVPVKLNKGENEFLFQRSRRSGGRLKARLLKPESEIMFNTYDSTLPDLLEGKDINTFGSIVLINATEKQQNKLAFTAQWPDGRKTVIDIPVIAPLSSRKVRFDLKHGPVDEDVTVKLAVYEKNKRKIYDSVEVPLKVKKPGQHYKITYISSVDNSVQYYSVVPVVGGDKDTEPGLVLSVHGASVEATNQAGSYANKSWCNIVCPTNRRPYGFDWEDWGMIEAIDVLNDAKSVLGCDESRVYLTGHSMGGHGTWIVGSTYPDLFAAIGPSAGWISFKTYAGGTGEGESPSEMETMLARAENHGDTTGLMENLTDKGVYILHGGGDRTVPPSQAQKMAEYLGEFHKDWMYHEEPGKGHWWNLSDEPGADCVDWRPMFDFFARHRLVSD
ncbi:MAG: prolyl oligopeptidase family serine peptidase, partial [Anaerohalosphaera sp.]|nr:prolyl oligopeptidase family serine peptidase [Anaerohalosphaera sp.]